MAGWSLLTPYAIASATRDRFARRANKSSTTAAAPATTTAAASDDHDSPTAAAARDDIDASTATAATSDDNKAPTAAAASENDDVVAALPSSATKSLKLYANMVSQPSRAVAWVLKVKGVEYEFVHVEFGGKLIKSDQFKSWNPNALVPVLRDNDFLLFEGNAILTYVAVKFGWTDLCPVDMQIRAKVDEFLHWHHTNTRLFTTQIVRPAVAKATKKASPADVAHLDNADALIEQEMTLLESFLLDHDYVAHTDAPTVADYAAYCEIDQLEMMGYDFAKYKRVAAWIARMKQLPFHDDVRKDLDDFLQDAGLRARVKNTIEL